MTITIFKRLRKGSIEVNVNPLGAGLDHVLNRAVLENQAFSPQDAFIQKCANKVFSEQPQSRHEPLEVRANVSSTSLKDLYDLLRGKVKRENQSKLEAVVNHLTRAKKPLNARDQEILFALAELFLDLDVYQTTQHIKIFAFKDQKTLIKFAELSVQKGGWATAANIHHFEIKSQAALVRIAKMCTKQYYAGIEKEIKNFGIEDQNSLIEIAKMWAQGHGWMTAMHIQNFGIHDREALIEIAKLCAQQDGKGTALNIRNFGITSELVLIEIAQLCAKQNGKETARHIQNFGIQDQEALIEIAKLCARQNGTGTARYIACFGILDQAALIEIAKLCVESSKGHAAKYMHAFEIKNPDVLFELANVCMQQSEARAAKFIGNFRLEGEKSFIEIAKLYAQLSGKRIAKNIKKFRITDQTALIEIAKLCALQPGVETAEHISSFKIQNQAALAEIAKLCILHSERPLGYYFNNFRIDDLALAVELAKMCIQKDLSNFLEFIKNFRIQDQSALIDLATICAQKNGWFTASGIRNFGIKDQAALVAIAKLCASGNGWRTAENIHEFGIEDQAVLTELAHLCVHAPEGWRMAIGFKTFGISEAAERFKLFVECIKQSDEPFSFVNNFRPFPASLQELFDLIEVLQSDDKQPVKRERLFEVIHTQIESIACSQEDRSRIHAECHTLFQLDPHPQRLRTMCFLRFVLIMQTLDQGAIKRMLESNLWKDVLDLRDPSLKQQLLGSLCAFVENPAESDRWNRFIQTTPSEKGIRLLAIPLFALEMKGVSLLLTNEVLQRVLRPLFLKDALKIQRVMHILYFIGDLSFGKEIALRKIFLEPKKPKEIVDYMTAAKGLMQIRNTEWIDSSVNIRQFFRGCFEKLVPLDGLKEDAALKYDQFFANSRNPTALLTYAAGLKTLGDPSLLECLGRYVVSVFQGTFQKMRYATPDNPHLAKIFHARPDLEEKWKASREMRLQQISSEEDQPIELFDAKKWLYDKLIRFNHLGDEDVSHVQAYLAARSDASRDLVKAKILDELGKGEESTVLNRNIQLSCMKLIDEGNDKTIFELEGCFRNIRNWLDAKDIHKEFTMDVLGMLAMIRESPLKQSSHVDFPAIITDDPIDLLLAGTDIKGSCQRVNGFPVNNRGLLGYMVDGKMVMIAIKDRSGKIVARAILKMLWDGEQPVLYRERFYPDVINYFHKKRMNDLAILLAKELRVPLTSGDEDGAAYGKTLYSLGGPAPYEYSDACEGVKSNGIYSFKEATISIKPS